MPTTRLYQQFERLAAQLPERSRQMTLTQVADLLCCTPRNARVLLGRMQEQGWLSWQASAGRGRRATLTLHDIPQAFRQQQLLQLIRQGKLEQAMQWVEGRAERLIPWLQVGTGMTAEGRQILRVPYYRPLPHLLPGPALRRSEIHLVRQIFSGLVRRNEENGEVEPDLAHHWEALTPRHWRFYLRPVVRFHHGRLLTAEDVVASLEALRCEPLFDHLQHCEVINPRTVDLHLGDADAWLPQLLCEPQAVILPHEWPGLAGFSLNPIGCGPYRVVTNDARRLRLQAFDDYFGLRALLDEIDIWMMPELAERLTYQLTVGQDRPELGQMRAESELESGCYFLLADGRSPALRDPVLRRWLAYRLNGAELLGRVDRQMQQMLTPARGLLPHWRDGGELAVPPMPEALPGRLVIACFNQHLEFEELARAMVTCLGQFDIALELRELDYAEWASGQAEDVDLWLGTVNMEHERDFAAYAWLQGIPLLHRIWSAEPWLWSGLTDWRSLSDEEHSPRRLLLRLQNEGWFMPLFHHWLSMESRVGVHGVRMTALGWFDFRRAWIKPEV